MTLYLGFRVGLTVLSGPLAYVEEPTYANSKNDDLLSTAIGGATGFFVRTEAAYLPEHNFVIDFVRIQPNTPALTDCAIGEASTSLGFLLAESGESDLLKWSILSSVL